MCFERKRSSSDQNNTGQIMVTCSATTFRNRSYFIFTNRKVDVCIAKQQNETTITKRPKLAYLPKRPKKNPDTKEIMPYFNNFFCHGYMFPWEFPCQQLTLSLTNSSRFSLVLVMFSTWTIRRPFKFGL